MTFSDRYRYLGNFYADTDILTTKFCHYFSINLTLIASLISSKERLLQTQVTLQYYSMKK